MQSNTIREEFKNYLNEWKKTPIEMDGNTLNIVKSNHVMQPRGSNSKIPRDGNMNKGKYEKIIKSASKYIDITRQFAIIFKDGEYYSGFTGVLVDSDIIIVTAIFKQVKSADKLFKDISNRYVIEKLLNKKGNS